MGLHGLVPLEVAAWQKELEMSPEIKGLSM